MELDKKNYDFLDEMSIQQAYDAGILNPEEWVDVVIFSNVSKSEVDSKRTEAYDMMKDQGYDILAQQE